MAGEQKPTAPPIPADARRAENHAAPTDLAKPAAQATPSSPVAEELPTDSTVEQVAPQQQAPVMTSPPARPAQAQPVQQAQQGSSPEPIEAMYAQLREDVNGIKKDVTALTVSLMVVAFAILLMVFLSTSKGKAALKFKPSAVQ